MRRAALRSMKSAGTNSGISPANLQGNSVVSKNVMWSMPERPASMLSQKSGTFVPAGVTAPRPVTRTRVRERKSSFIES